MSTPQIDKMGAEEKNNNKINLSIILIKSWVDNLINTQKSVTPSLTQQ